MRQRVSETDRDRGRDTERQMGGRERERERRGQRERELFSESQTVHSQQPATTPLHTNKQVTDTHSPTA